MTSSSPLGTFVVSYRLSVGTPTRIVQPDNSLCQTGDSGLLRLLPDCPQLFRRQQALLAAHGFPGTDQIIERHDTTPTPEEINLQRFLMYALEVTYAQYRGKHIQRPQVGSKVEIFDFDFRIRIVEKGKQLGRKTMDRVQVPEGIAQSPDILGRQDCADIEVTRDE